MFVRAIRVLAVASLAAGTLVAAPVAASAVDGTFAWTKITTPGKTFTYHVSSAEGALNHLTVSGTTSADVSNVQIGCAVGNAVSGFGGTPLASNVEVDHGAFSAVVTVSRALGVCRLRALPSNLDPAVPYLGSFSGPIMYSWTFGEVKDGTKPVSFAVATGFGSGVAALADASACAVVGLTTVDVPDVEQRGPSAPQCELGLHPQNITDTGISTASAVRVDGKNAYLPGGVFGYLRDPNFLGLTLSQPSITTTFARSSTTGNVTVTESLRLKRCNGANTFPPTAQSCASLVDTGVTFKRVLDLVRGNHQVLIHDSYVSNDGSGHSVAAEYQSLIARAQYGAPGFIFPTHPQSFRKAYFDKVVTGFGTGPKTVLARSDIYADSADPQADTQALTWSRPPSEIRFAHDSISLFALPYTFHVLAHGAAKIAFAVSEAPLTADAKALAAKAVTAL